MRARRDSDSLTDAQMKLQKRIVFEGSEGGGGRWCRLGCRLVANKVTAMLAVTAYGLVCLSIVMASTIHNPHTPHARTHVYVYVCVPHSHSHPCPFHRLPASPLSLFFPLAEQLLHALV